jgi:sec-independent protein translocase protein TatC
MAKPQAQPQPADTDLDDGRMPFIEHLRELRIRLRNAALFFIIGFVGCWYFADEIFQWVKQPLDDAWAQHPSLGEMPELNFGSLVEPFWADMSMGLWAGIFISSPFSFYQLWKFIAPGLYKTERSTGLWFAAASAFFFVAGAAFCYYVVLEQMFVFLLGYANRPGLNPVLMLSEHISLTRNMMLAFGAVFELPVLIYFLAKIGLVTHRGLWKFNRWFVVIAFIIGALLTPSTDPISQVLMAAPMIVLYNFSIIVAWVVVRNRERATAD